MGSGHAVVCSFFMFIAVFFFTDTSVWEKVVWFSNICFWETFLKIENTIGGQEIHPSWPPKYVTLKQIEITGVTFYQQVYLSQEQTHF